MFKYAFKKLKLVYSTNSISNEEAKVGNMITSHLNMVNPYICKSVCVYN